MQAVNQQGIREDGEVHDLQETPQSESPASVVTRPTEEEEQTDRITEQVKTEPTPDQPVTNTMPNVYLERLMLESMDQPFIIQDPSQETNLGNFPSQIQHPTKQIGSKSGTTTNNSGMFNYYSLCYQ